MEVCDVMKWETGIVNLIPFKQGFSCPMPFPFKGTAFSTRPVSFYFGVTIGIAKIAEKHNFQCDVRLIIHKRLFFHIQSGNNSGIDCMLRKYQKRLQREKKKSIIHRIF